MSIEKFIDGLNNKIKAHVLSVVPASRHVRVAYKLALAKERSLKRTTFPSERTKGNNGFNKYRSMRIDGNTTNGKH